MIQPYDAPTIAVLRRALDDVCADRRFIRQRSTSTLEIAEHLLAHRRRPSTVVCNLPFCERGGAPAKIRKARAGLSSPNGVLHEAARSLFVIGVGAIGYEFH